MLDWPRTGHRKGLGSVSVACLRFLVATQRFFRSKYQHTDDSEFIPRRDLPFWLRPSAPYLRPCTLWAMYAGGG